MIAGCRKRQQQTAEEVARAYREAGLHVPDLVSDANWNEFDMAAVFSEFAPHLCEADPQFKRDYDELMRKLEVPDSPIHQEWTECDTATMRAWMEARYPCKTETWAVFRDRVLKARESLAQYGSGETVAVFSSAAPISIWVAASLGVSDSNVMRLAAVM